MGLFQAARDVKTINALLTGAETHARRKGDALPGPEHLLLSALQLPDGTALEAFKRVGADPSQFAAAIDSVHADALSAVGIDPPAPEETLSKKPRAFRATAPAQRAFQDAVAASKTSSAGSLLGAHIVAAVCAQERGTAALALHSLGVDRDVLRAAAEGIGQQSSGTASP